MMHPAFWGKGLATEVMKYTLNLAFSVYGFKTVYALTVKENKRSQQVMQRLGMTFSDEIVLFRGRPHLLAFINSGS